MKKIIAVLISLVVIASAFAACSKPQKKEDNASTAPVTAEVPKVEKTTTDTAKIKNADAASLIKSYSAKELSLSEKDKKECSFLTNESGIKIGDDYYISVIAAYKISEKGEDGKTYIKFDHKGEYYIRYDGQKILKKNMENKEKDEYTELKVKEVPKTEAPEKETSKKG